MIFKKFTVGDIGNNNYLLIDNGEAALVDATEIIPELDFVLKENKADLKYIFLTHGHFDHISGVKRLQDKYGVTVYMHPADMDIVSDSNEFLSMVGLPTIDIPQIDAFIYDGDKVKVGNTELEVIALPGHTPGGVGYKTDNILFSGDTIFMNSVGRTDLPGGDSNLLANTIRTRIYTLDDNTIIYTGHGADTSVGYEKKYNSIVRA